MKLRTPTDLELFVALVAVAVVCIAIVAYNSIPRCLRSHTETVHVEQTTVMIPIVHSCGNGCQFTTFMPMVIPAHDEQVTVCDEYESN